MIAKYRAKRIDNGEWVYGVPVECEGRCWIANSPRMSYFDEDSEWVGLNLGTFEVDPKTVGQFTGKQDKNGKEIYLGDGYCTNGGAGDAWVVEWIDGGFAFVHVKDRDVFMFSELFMDEEEMTFNIHDNPELVKL